MNDLVEKRSLIDALARRDDDVQLPVPGGVWSGGTVEQVGAQKVARYRDESSILKKLKVLAAGAGNDWFYRFPVKNKSGRVEWVEGPSIKLANDLVRIYGNLDVRTQVIDIGDAWVIYARIWDLEGGSAYSRPFQQRKSQAKQGMKTDPERQLDIALQIGVSKSIRNAVTNFLEYFATFAFEEAKHSLIEEIGKELNRWRERALEIIRDTLQIDPIRVEAVIGRKAGDWLAADVARVRAMVRAINEGMATTDETFPPLDTKTVEGQATSDPPGETADGHGGRFTRTADENQSEPPAEEK